MARSISVTILLCIFMQRDVRKTQEMSHDQAPTRGKDVSRSEMSVKSLRVTIPLYARYSMLNLIERRFVSAPFQISAICSFAVVILAKLLDLSLLVTGFTMN